MKLLMVFSMIMMMSCGKNNTTPKDDQGFGPRGGEREVQNADESLFHLKVILRDSVLNIEEMTINDEPQELEDCTRDDQIIVHNDGSFTHVENTLCEEEESSEGTGQFEIFSKSGEIIIEMEQADGSVVEFTLVSYGRDSLTLRTVQYFGSFEYLIDIKYAIRRP